ncbi:MAG: hypothetical protein V4660_15515 [Pseudomonadota bacterium]
MKINHFFAWGMGYLLILMSILLGELSVAFHDYFYQRLGLNRNILLTLLWGLFFLAAYIASYYSSRFKLLLGFSYIFVIPLTAAIVHYVNEQLGTTVDFSGIAGAVTVFKIYFFAGGFLAVAGTLLGLFFSRNKI